MPNDDLWLAHVRACFANFHPGRAALAGEETAHADGCPGFASVAGRPRRAKPVPDIKDIIQKTTLIVPFTRLPTFTEPFTEVQALHAGARGACREDEGLRCGLLHQ